MLDKGFFGFLIVQCKYELNLDETKIKFCMMGYFGTFIGWALVLFIIFKMRKLDDTCIVCATSG